MNLHGQAACYSKCRDGAGELMKIIRKVMKEWCAQGDDFRTFLTNFVADLTCSREIPDLNV